MDSSPSLDLHHLAMTVLSEVNMLGIHIERYLNNVTLIDRASHSVAANIPKYCDGLPLSEPVDIARPLQTLLCRARKMQQPPSSIYQR